MCVLKKKYMTHKLPHKFNKLPQKTLIMVTAIYFSSFSLSFILSSNSLAAIDTHNSLSTYTHSNITYIFYHLLSPSTNFITIINTSSYYSFLLFFFLSPLIHLSVFLSLSLSKSLNPRKSIDTNLSLLPVLHSNGPPAGTTVFYSSSFWIRYHFQGLTTTSHYHLLMDVRRPVTSQKFLIEFSKTWTDVK